jgi:hypothetical protein
VHRSSTSVGANPSKSAGDARTAGARPAFDV